MQYFIYLLSVANHNLSLSQLTRLTAFAAHLLHHKLDEFVARKLAVASELNLHLGANRGSANEGGKYALLKSSAVEMLSFLAEGKGLDFIQESLEKWQKNEVPFFSKENVQAEDITKLCFLRKKVFASFIPTYCNNLMESMKLVEEIDVFLLEWETASSNNYLSFLKSHIDTHLHFIEKITNTSPGIIYVYDVVNEKEVYTNKTITEFIGYNADEVMAMGSGFVDLLIHPEDVPMIRIHEKEFGDIADGEIRSIKYRIKNKQGNYHWLRAYESVFKRNEKGEVVQKIGIAIDVNAQVETAQKLRRSEALYKQAEAISHIGSWSWVLAENEVSWSDELYRIFGLEAGSRVDFELYKSFLHPEDRERIIQVVEAAIKNIEPYSFDHRIVLHDGTIRYLFAVGNIILNDKNEPVQLVGTAQDVSERHLLIEKLQKSQDLYKQAQALAHIGNWTHELAAKEFIWSDEMYRIYELPIAEKITEEDWESFIHPQDRDEVLTYTENISATRARYDKIYRILLRNGTVKTIHRKGEFVYDASGVPVQMIGTTQDVTEQQKMQLELKENQQFISKIANATPSVIASYNIHTGRYSFISEGLTKLLGYSIEEVKEKGVAFFMNLIHPDDLPALMKANAERIEEANVADSSDVKEFVYRIRHKNGSYRWFHTYGTVFDRNSRGGVEHVLNISLDITEQVEANKKIKEQELFIQQIADASPTILYIFDISSNSIEYVNKEIYFVLGYSTEEVQDMGADVVKLLYHPEDLQLLPERRESSKKFQHINSMIQYECRVKSKSDEWKWLLVREIIFKNENGDKPAQILGAALDITKRKEMERSLLQNSFQLEQSNASLEEFAYVASHDLKEPLRKISTFGDRLAASQADKLSNEGQIYLKKIIDASQRMQLMISDLLSISMISGNQAYELYSLQTVLEDALQALEFKIEQKNAVINASSLPEAHIIVSQFRQLFQNLLSNSLKFVKEDVQPVVNITATYLSQQDLDKYKLTSSARYLQLQFADNGIGFEEEYAGKIFQIFQRLHGRSEYEGTGIGLAICKKIVEHHGGIIFANGQAGLGATFTIIIPA